jgi:hypothetical protein
MIGVWTMFALVWLPPWHYGTDDSKRPGRPAAELLSAGVAKAKELDKRVFLLFDSPG